MTFLADIAREAEEFAPEFSESVTWTPAGGSATSIIGIVDVQSEVTDIGEMIQMDGVAATIDVATKHMPGVAHGDVVVARGVTYKVVGVEPDGTGRTMVVLGI